MYFFMNNVVHTNKNLIAGSLVHKIKLFLILKIAREMIWIDKDMNRLRKIRMINAVIFLTRVNEKEKEKKKRYVIITRSGFWLPSKCTIFFSFSHTYYWQRIQEAWKLVMVLPFIGFSLQLFNLRLAEIDNWHGFLIFFLLLGWVKGKAVFS